MICYKSKISIAMAIIWAVFVGSAKAQIATPEGQIQGGNGSDTAHFIDRPSMHVHEETIVLEKKKKAEAHGGRNEEAASNAPSGTNNGQQKGVLSDTIGGVNQSEANSNPELNVPASGSAIVINSVNSDYLYGALAALGIGALIGLFLLAMILRSHKTSAVIGLLHGALGLIGIGMLIAYSMFFSGLVVSIVILAIAATAGIVVFYKDISQQPIPKWLAVTHGVIALTGIITLVVFAVSK